MGRELRRVPLDFAWPLNKTWKGFLNPHPYPPQCEACGGTGKNPATKAISDDWHDSEGFGTRWGYVYGTGRDGQPAARPPWKIWGQTRRWMHDLTQDEVDALVAAGRLMDLTHNWSRDSGWTRKEPAVRLTAAEVNEWSHSFFGHDCINQWICVEARARRLGVYGKCAVCRGSGEQRLPRKMKKRYNGWTPTDPPAGPGYQVWETVSEGSPVSPVFAVPEDLVLWLVEHENYTVEGAANFVRVGWVPSLLMVGNGQGGRLYRDIDSAAVMGGA